MLLKCYHYLHSIIEYKVRCVNQIIDGNFNLDIYKQTFSTSEQTKELVTKTSLIFKCYQVNPKEIKCPFQWWGKMKSCFLFLVFWLAKS